MARLQRTLTLCLSSWFGLGYLPRAPGTWGTLGALPAWWLVAQLPHLAACGVVAGFVVVSCAVAHAAERLYGGHDASHIVIDEVAGLLVCSLAIPFELPWIVAAFILFRIFDITKPGPIGWLDRHVGGGVGVVMDDVAAGFAGWVVLQGVRFSWGS